MMFKNKIVIVTGGGNGIGKSIAKKFSELNATVCVTDLNLDDAKKTASECKNKSYYFKLDVTKKNENKKIFSKINAIVGNYNILVSNAGVSSMNKIEDLTEDEENFCIEFNSLIAFPINLPLEFETGTFT